MTVVTATPSVAKSWPPCLPTLPETGGHESWRPEAEWRQALVHVREMGWSEGQKGGYNGECNPDVWQGQTGLAVKIKTAIS